MNPEQRLTPKQAAELAAVSIDVLRRAYRSGELESHRNHGVKIRWADLERWMNRAPVQPRPRAPRAAPTARRAAPPERGSLAALDAIEARRRAS